MINLNRIYFFFGKEIGEIPISGKLDLRELGGSC